MAKTRREVREPEGANDVVDGPEFVKLCADCEAKLRRMSAAKIRISGDEGPGAVDAMVGNLTVPRQADIPLILDVSSVELDMTVGMAYLESKDA